MPTVLKRFVEALHLESHVSFYEVKFRGPSILEFSHKTVLLLVFGTTYVELKNDSLKKTPYVLKVIERPDKIVSEAFFMISMVVLILHVMKLVQE